MNQRTYQTSLTNSRVCIYINKKHCVEQAQNTVCRTGYEPINVNIRPISVSYAHTSDSFNSSKESNSIIKENEKI